MHADPVFRQMFGWTERVNMRIQEQVVMNNFGLKGSEAFGYDETSKELWQSSGQSRWVQNNRIWLEELFRKKIV